MKVVPNFMNWEGGKICFELRAHLSPWRQCRNVRTFVPSKCPTGRTFKCPPGTQKNFPTKKKMSSESKGQKMKVAPNFMNWESKTNCFELGAHLGGMAAPYQFSFAGHISMFHFELVMNSVCEGGYFFFISNQWQCNGLLSPPAPLPWPSRNQSPLLQFCCFDPILPHSSRGQIPKFKKGQVDLAGLFSYMWRGPIRYG